MRSRRFGYISLAFGCVAVLLGVCAKHVMRAWLPYEGNVLGWLEAHGLVRSPSPDRVPSLEPTSLLPVSDLGALQFLSVYSLSFAAFAILFALWAEYAREDNHPLSAGFIMGAVAVTLFSFEAGIAVMLAGGICVTLFRRRA